VIGNHAELCVSNQRLAILGLAAILLLNLEVDLWGNSWGAPARWHADEMYRRAERMVDARTIDSQYYPFGELHYYTLALLAVAPARLYARSFDRRPAERGTLADSSWARRNMIRITPAARAVSGIYAALLVGVTCWLGILALGLEAGLFAATLLAVNPFLVTIGHFATVDAAADFWYWVACTASFQHMRSGRWPWLLMAALLSGLAIGLKADRVVVIAALLTAFVYARPRAHLRDLGVAGILILVGFVIANPSIIITPFGFVDGYTRDLWFNALRSPRDNEYLALLRNLREGLGWPVLALVVLGGSYAVSQLWRKGARPTLVWFATAFLPYAFLLGIKNNPWYVPMLFPPLLLLGAFGYVEGRRALAPAFARAGWVVAAGLVAWSLYRSAIVVAQFANDARDAAGRWVVEHVPPGSSILVAGNGPALPLGRYQLSQPVRMELCPNAVEPRERLERSPRYRAFRDGLFTLEHWLATHLGTRLQQKPYRAWFDWYAEQCAAPRTGHSDPDFVVVVAGSWVKDIPREELKQPYRTVKHFEYLGRGASGPYMDFVNPAVDIYARKAASRSELPPARDDVSYPLAAATDTWRRGGRVMERTAGAPQGTVRAPEHTWQSGGGHPGRRACAQPRPGTFRSDTTTASGR
jgi:hypothetical protein